MHESLPLSLRGPFLPKHPAPARRGSLALRPTIATLAPPPPTRAASLSCTISPVTCEPIKVPGLQKPLRRLRDADGQVKYVLHQPHAKGAFGSVSYASDTQGNLLAAKQIVVREDHTPQPDALPATRPVALQTIQREVLAQRAVGSPTQPQDILQHDDTLFLIMPARSGDLEGLHNRATQLAFTVDDKRVLMRNALLQLSDELTGVHAAGFVHADIKLSNTLYSAQGEVSLADFGAMTPINPRTQMAPRGRRGTPGFMAPENLERGQYNQKADMWSLCLTFCDFWSPRQINPFIRIEDKPQSYALFDHWRSSQSLGAGDGLQLSGTAEQTGFSRFFSLPHAADPEVTEFGLHKLLKLNPHERADAAELTQFLSALQPPGGSDDQRAQALFAQLAQTDNKLPKVRAELAQGLAHREPRPASRGLRRVI